MEFSVPQFVHPHLHHAPIRAVQDQHHLLQSHIYFVIHCAKGCCHEYLKHPHLHHNQEAAVQAQGFLCCSMQDAREYPVSYFVHSHPHHTPIRDIQDQHTFLP